MAADRALVIAVVTGLGFAILLAGAALVTSMVLWRELGRVRRAALALSDGGLYGLDQLLREQGLHVRQVDDRVSDLERRLKQAEGRLRSALRHVHVLRFSPFREVGGDQSFVIALVDDGGSGIVITGLQTRAEMRVFVKPLRDGNSPYVLSDEEIAAVRAAFVPDEAGAAS